MNEISYLEVVVEEPSMEEVLKVLLPKIAPEVEFSIRVFSGKHDLLKKLSTRLKGYAAWLSRTDGLVVVLLDRDDDDCLELKYRLEREAGGLAVHVLNRIVIEELEAWFFGDVQALISAYPRLPATLGKQARFRDPDGITGGTWEALERLLQKHGYHSGGLPKISAARNIAAHMTIESNTSRSFQVFRDGVVRHLDGVEEQI